MNQEERRALEKVVERLLIAVKEQEKKFGYLFWKHSEKENNLKGGFDSK
jgi:hypothetical protein